MNRRPETLLHFRNRIDLASTGEEMLALMGALNPICRSISGDGLRQSLCQLADSIPLTTHEVATGTRAFDWIVPKEWNIRDAYIKDSAGRRVIDFQNNNLHVVNYSAPVNARMTLRKLLPRLHSLPERPEDKEVFEDLVEQGRMSLRIGGSAAAFASNVSRNAG
jgi:aminopeptidase-like protein